MPRARRLRRQADRFGRFSSDCREPLPQFDESEVVGYITSAAEQGKGPPKGPNRSKHELLVPLVGRLSNPEFQEVLKNLLVNGIAD
jgi:hypothetical protein